MSFFSFQVLLTMAVPRRFQLRALPPAHLMVPGAMQRFRRRRDAELRLWLLQQQGLQIAALAVAVRADQRRRRPRRFWVREWIGRRMDFGQYDTLIQELIRESPNQDFVAFMRMDVVMFREVCDRVGPRLEAFNQRRPGIAPGLKLAITLRFLATGSAYRALEFDFRVAHNTIARFVPEVCRAIQEEYAAEVFQTPQDPDGWRRVERGFRNRWNLPHCCGALDGKHVAIKNPSHAGSLYHNYKGFFSIIMMALVDADYKFLWVNVGTPGSNSDAGVFLQSTLRAALEDGTLGLPPADRLPNDDRDTAYYLVGDDAFPLREYLQKPYPIRQMTREQRIYNYRVSRGRRVVENAFGILASRFRCLLTTMLVEPEVATEITRTCLTLHNLMRMRYPQLQNQEVDGMQRGDLVPGRWRAAGELQAIERAARGGAGYNRAGRWLREYLARYFCSPAGSVPWQDEAIERPLR